MLDNSQQILNDVLSQQRQDRFPDLSEQDYFEIFCAEQILKDFDLSYEEIAAGIVDGEHDGGVDAIYSFVNGDLIVEDFDTSPFKKDVKIELFIIQSKTSGGFSEAPLNKLISITRQLMKLDADFSIYTNYNDAVKSAIDGFRQVYRSLASRFPGLVISYYYASKKADIHIHENLTLKATELRDAANSLFADAIVQTEFLGARRLLDLARRRPKTTFELQVSKSLSATNGYVGLSTLTAYNTFLRGEDNSVRHELFESNVRDFQGDTEVNEEIQKTLQNETSVDFWWMNNGVTILASRATLNGDTVSIENPQIVNGLQTSTQIARHFDVVGAGFNDKRNVLIKVISSEIEESRDKIIKATNSQNAVQPATLRATDKIQRDIELTLKTSGLFYDRRKNFYKNEGRPGDKIISIPLMAQAVMSIILQHPDTARARPSSLLKDNIVYSQVFSYDYPIALYSKAAELIQKPDRILKSRYDLLPRNRANIRFYVLYWLAASLSGNADPTPSQFTKVDVKLVSDAEIEDAINLVNKIYVELGASDQIAKGPELQKIIHSAMCEALPTKSDCIHKQA